MFKRLLSLFAVCLLASATFAHADIIENFSLTQDGCSGGCGAGPYGTITLDQMGAGTTASPYSVTVTETIAPNVFVGTGAGQSLEFNVTGAGTITISSITSGFSSTGASSASTFGSFLDSVDCEAGGSCGPGASKTNPGPISFVVTSASGVTDADFTANSDGNFFASDIIGVNGKTGNVAADTCTIVSGTDSCFTHDSDSSRAVFAAAAGNGSCWSRWPDSPSH